MTEFPSPAVIFAAINCPNSSCHLSKHIPLLFFPYDRQTRVINWHISDVSMPVVCIDWHFGYVPGLFNIILNEIFCEYKKIYRDSITGRTEFQEIVTGKYKEANRTKLQKQKTWER